MTRTCIRIHGGERGACCGLRILARVAPLLAVLSTIIAITASSEVHAVTADVAKQMCEEFHKDKASAERTQSINDCLNTLSIDSPAPKYSGGAASSTGSFGRDLIADIGNASLSTGLIIAVALLYFVPAVVAVVRKKRDRVAILILNLFLGWTYVGWVLALVWAATYDTRRAEGGEQATKGVQA